MISSSPVAAHDCFCSLIPRDQSWGWGVTPCLVVSVILECYFILHSFIFIPATMYCNVCVIIGVLIHLWLIRNPLLNKRATS